MNSYVFWSGTVPMILTGALLVGVIRHVVLVNRQERDLRDLSVDLWSSMAECRTLARSVPDSSACSDSITRTVTVPNGGGSGGGVAMLYADTASARSIDRGPCTCEHCGAPSQIGRCRYCRNPIEVRA